MQPAPVQLQSAEVTGLPLSSAFSPRGIGGPTLSQILELMDPATLDQLDAVALLNRLDTKFLLTVSQLVSVLPSLAQDYRVLDIQGRRLHQYRTLYFDTPEYDLYRRHHAGQVVRHKVRSRSYVDTGLAFFEIKSKTSKRRTVKHRLKTPVFLSKLSADAGAFLTSHLPSGDSRLRPALRNDFLRVTLVGKRSPERLTLDLNIHFDCEGRTAILPGIAIAELKQGNLNPSSPFLRAMRGIGVASTSISKYCVGIGLLVSNVEHDAFDENLKAIERLMRSQIDERMAAIDQVLSAQG